MGFVTQVAFQTNQINFVVYPWTEQDSVSSGVQSLSCLDAHRKACRELRIQMAILLIDVTMASGHHSL